MARSRPADTGGALLDASHAHQPAVAVASVRLPPVKRWIAEQQKAGRDWLVYLAVVPLAVLFVLGFSFIVNEEIFKGVDAFTLHPSDE